MEAPLSLGPTIEQTTEIPEETQVFHRRHFKDTNMPLTHDEKLKLKQSFAAYRDLSPSKLGAILNEFDENQHIEVLSLKHCELAMSEMARALSRNSGANSKLSCLRLHDCDVGQYLAQLAPELKKMTALKYLELNNNPLKTDEFEHLTTSLLGKGGLTHLSLENTTLTSDSIVQLADLLASNKTSLVYLDLSSNQLIPAEVQYLTAALKNNKTLKFLKLGGDMLISPKDVDSLKAVASTEGFRLLGTNLDELSTPYGYRSSLVFRHMDSALLRQIFQPHVISLDFANNLSTVPNFANQLLENILASKNLKSLQTLTLDKNDMGRKPAIFKKTIQALKEKTGLKELYLRSSGIKASALIGLSLPETLIKLNLENNPLYEPGMVEVARFLRETPLELLDLEHTRMGDQGAIELAGALRTNTSLKRLVIQNNEITDIGANALISALRENAAIPLEDLDIAGNYQISKLCLIDLARVVLEKKAVIKLQGWNDMPDIEAPLQELMKARQAKDDEGINQTEFALNTILNEREKGLLKAAITEVLDQGSRLTFDDLCTKIKDHRDEIDILRATHQLITNPKNSLAQEQYNKQIKKAKVDPSPLRQLVANLLMTLGILIVVGAGVVALTVATAGIAAPVAIAAVGTVGLASFGGGFFANLKQDTDVSKDLSDLKQAIDSPKKGI